MDNEKEGTPITAMHDRLKGRFASIPPSDAQRMFLVELSKIRPNPDQPRRIFDEEGLQELAQSIQDYGQLAPIILKQGEEPGAYILVAGERRYRAHQLLGKDEIYAILTEGDVDEVSLIENIHRQDLHPLELAESFQRLMEKHAWNQEELAQVMRKNRRTINEVLRLNRLPDEIKEQCRNSTDVVSASVLIQIARIDDIEQQRLFWKQAQEGTLSLRRARARRKSDTPKAGTSPLKQILSTGKGFVKKLRDVPRRHIDDDGLYQLVELQKEITDCIEDIRLNRGD
jgi:ParB family transcriptional regulator, chromosome partitioning protein